MPRRSVLAIGWQPGEDTSDHAPIFYVGLPVLEKIIRPILVYGFLILGLRLAGRRELAQLNPFDLVVLLTLSNTVQNAEIDGEARRSLRDGAGGVTSRDGTGCRENRSIIT